MYIDTLVDTTRLKPVRARNEVTTAGCMNDDTETLLFMSLLNLRSLEIGNAAASSDVGSRISCAKPLSLH